MNSKLITIVAMASTALVAGNARSDGGSLSSPSFWVRAHTLNNGCTSYLGQQSPSFRGNGCVGELGNDEHVSPSYRLLAGFCAEERWLLGQGTTVSVPGGGTISTVLAAPSPNPARGTVGIGFSVRPGERGTVRVFDVAGRMVRTLADRARGPVSQAIRWDLTDDAGREVAAGIYFVRLTTESIELTRRVVLLGH